MKRRLQRICAGLLAALTLCMCPRFAGAAQSEDAPAVKAFSFTRSGSSVAEARGYEIKETERGRFVWIRLYYSYTIVLPMTDEDMAAFSELAAKQMIKEWDGFKKSDHTVLDGEDFSLDVEYEDGSSVSAYGSNSFPKGYRESMSVIEDFFWGLMEEYEIDVGNGWY